MHPSVFWINYIILFPLTWGKATLSYCSILKFSTLTSTSQQLTFSKCFYYATVWMINLWNVRVRWSDTMFDTSEQLSCLTNHNTSWDHMTQRCHLSTCLSIGWEHWKRQIKFTVQHVSLWDLEERNKVCFPRITINKFNSRLFCNIVLFSFFSNIVVSTTKAVLVQKLLSL